MKKTTMKIVALSALVACMSSAYADYSVDRTGSYYFSPAFGMYSPDANRNLNSAFAGTFSAGYNFSNFLAAQLLVGASSLGATQNGQNQNMALANIEGLVNMPTNTAFVPYFAIGMGTVSIDHNAFDVDTGVGFNYYLAPQFAVGVNYRHIDDFNNSMSDNLVTVGLTWSFGGNSNLVVAKPAQDLNAKQQVMLQQAKQTLHDVLPNGVSLCNGSTATPENGCVTIDGDKMTMHLDVKFANNQANIAGQYPSAINRLGNFLTAYPSTNVTLYGYASKVGTEAYNVKLSLRRANNVKAYLVESKGIAAARIATVGKGTQDPIASNATHEGRALNRRVQADVPVPTSAATAPVAEPAAIVTAPAKAV